MGIAVAVDGAAVVFGVAGLVVVVALVLPLALMCGDFPCN